MSPAPRADVTTEALDRVEQRTPEVTQGGVDREIRHLRDLMQEADRRYEQRFEAADQAVSAALTSAKEAVTKAEQASEKRFEGVNEFRAQLADQQRTFIPRIEAEQRIGALEQTIRELDSRFQSSTAEKRGGKEVWGFIVGGVGVLLAIASFAIRARP